MIVVYFFILGGFSEAYKASKETKNIAFESSTDTRWWDSAIGIHLACSAGAEEAVLTGSKAEAQETW